MIIYSGSEDSFLRRSNDDSEEVGEESRLSNGMFSILSLGQSCKIKAWKNVLCHAYHNFSKLLNCSSQFVKGRGGPSIPGWSDFLSDCFKLKLKRWRITWYHQKPLKRKFNAYWSRFKIVEIPVRVSSDTQNRTYRDQSKKVGCFAQQLFFNKNDFFKMGSGPKWTVNGA